MELVKAEIIAGLGVMTGVIGFMWNYISAQNKRDQEQLKECRKGRDEQAQKIETLTADFNYLKGKMEGVENLSRAVLQKLEERKDDV